MIFSMYCNVILCYFISVVRILRSWIWLRLTEISKRFAIKLQPIISAICSLLIAICIGIMNFYFAFMLEVRISRDRLLFFVDKLKLGKIFFHLRLYFLPVDKLK